jgi:hypothetical protein
MIDFNYLRDIAAIVDGIPDKHFNLDVYANSMLVLHGLKQPTCGTIGCAVGWLSRHPDLAPPHLHGCHGPWRVAAVDRISGVKVLTTSWEDVELRSEVNRIFDSITDYHEEKLPHKTIFARRVIKFLDDHQQPVSDEYRRKYGM